MTKTTHPHHYLCRFTEYHGEYEMTQYLLLSTETKGELDEAIDLLLQTWWGDDTDVAPYDGGVEYWHPDGGAEVQFEKSAPLTEATFNELVSEMPSHTVFELRVAAASQAAAAKERADD